jgi:hypothetical protein
LSWTTGSILGPVLNNIKFDPAVDDAPFVNLNAITKYGGSQVGDSTNGITSRGDMIESAGAS